MNISVCFFFSANFVQIRTPFLHNALNYVFHQFFIIGVCLSSLIISFLSLTDYMYVYQCEY